MAGKGYTGGERARMLAPAAILSTAVPLQLGLGALRDELFGDKERTAAKRNENPAWRGLEAMSRSGLMGGADPFVNAVVSSLRYDSSPASVLQGPAIGRIGRGVAHQQQDHAQPGPCRWGAQHAGAVPDRGGGGRGAKSLTVTAESLFMRFG